MEQEKIKAFLEKYQKLCLEYGLRLNATLQLQTNGNTVSASAVLQVVVLEIGGQNVTD